MKKFTKLLLLWLIVAFSNAHAQTVLNTETFPNSFNTGLVKPINSTFSGSTGTWSAYSTTSYGTVAVNSEYYKSSPYALKLINYVSTGCSSVTYAIATSPTTNCTTSCYSSLSLCFDLYTACVVSTNNSFILYVEVSKDNGVSWTTLLGQTAAQLYASYGQGTWNNICLTLPSTFNNSSFKYRLVGAQNANCSSNNFLFIDDIKIKATACATLTLGNLVWLDLNGNNVKDATEPGVPNATVKLYDDANNDNLADGAAVATTTTNASGNYTFTGLAAGNYIVGVIIPTNYTRGAAATADPDDNVDNDNNAVNQIGASTAGGEMRSKAITLSQGTEPTTDGDDNNGNLTLDLALCPAANLLSLGNLVWLDLNGNNVKDANEPAVPNATVKLYADANNDNVADGAAIATTTTNASGNYVFTGLNGGNYIVGVTIPSGYTKGAASTVDPDTDVDNDNNGVNLIGGNGAGGEVRSLAITLQPFTEPTNDGDNNNGNQTLDIALCPAANLLSLGNLVWLDLNGNNVKDATEPAVPNATVKLYADANNDNIVDGTAIATTTTNASGNYVFTGLNGGNYIVGVIIPSGYTKGAASTVDPDNDVDNDNNGVNLIGTNGAGGEVRSLAITLIPFSEPATDGDDNNGNLTLDIALCPAANLLSVGNLVWLDLNGNNVKDATEPAVPNATVKLYADANNDNIVDGTAIATTTTNASGNYVFTGLNGGNYIVGVIIPSGYTKGAASTVDPDNDVDNDNNGVNLIGTNGAGGEVRSLAITLSPFSEPTTDGDDNNGNQTLDIALCPAANLLKLGNLVWLDINANNVKDATEPVIPNATVKLYADANNDNVADGAALATTTTDANGTYAFTGLNGGNYIVGVTIPANYQARVNAGNDPDNDIDNDNNGVTLVGANQPGSEVRSLAITLTPFIEPTTDGDDSNGNQTLDFGMCPAPNNLALGNLVWLDLNGNNLKDATEPGVPNATVYLYADANNDNVADGAALATTTTNATGAYSFTGLAAGNYIVGVIIPTNYTRGSVTTVDPDTDIDNDNNGVTLLGANQAGSEVRSLAITLSPFTEPTTDGDDNNGNQTLDIALCPAPNILTLGNLVFLDINANNVKDATDPVIPNATVYLYKDADNNNVADGAAIATATTDANGLYSFTGLAAGNYIVGVIIPENYQARINGTIDPDNDVDNDNNAVNLVGANIPGNEVRSNAITLLQFTEPTTDGDGSNANETLDMAMCPAPTGLTLGNFVWNDYDGDGKKDLNEPGIGNVTVSLYKDDNNDNIPDKGSAIATSITTTTGYYSFTNLAPGRYIVSMPILPGYTPSPNKSTQATSPYPDNNIDNDNNAVRVVNGVQFTNSITLTFGEEPTTDGDGANGNLTFDMALCGNAYVGDFVWNDLNGNGIQDAGEPGINGQTVTILFPDGVTTATTTTLNFNGTDGYYNFPNLGPGTHVITFTTPAGLTPSPANQGNDDTKDSDPINGSVSVNIVANISDFTIDAGFKTPSILGLGNLVFIDLNGNGVRDLTEPGIPGANVNLYRDTNGDNAPDGAAIATTTTGNDGTYHFTGLSADAYIVGVVLPTGYYFISGNPLPNNDIDNDNNAVRQVGNEVRTNFIILSPGTEPTTDGDDNNTNSTLDIAMLITCPTAKGTATSATSITGKASGLAATDVVEKGVSIYPNPAINSFTVKINADKQSAAVIWVTDANGRTINSKNLSVIPGTNLVQMNADHRMASGVYTITTVVNGKISSQKLVVSK